MPVLNTKQPFITVEVDGIKVTGKPLDADLMEEIREKNTKIVGKGQAARVVPDAKGIALDTFVNLIDSWEGALDQDNKPLKCTIPNKKLVFKHDQKFVKDVTVAIAVKRIEMRDAEKKI